MVTGFPAFLSVIFKTGYVIRFYCTAQGAADPVGGGPEPGHHALRDARLFRALCPRFPRQGPPSLRFQQSLHPRVPYNNLAESSFHVFGEMLRGRPKCISPIEMMGVGRSSWTRYFIICKHRTFNIYYVVYISYVTGGDGGGGARRAGGGRGRAGNQKLLL